MSIINTKLWCIGNLWRYLQWKFLYFLFITLTLWIKRCQDEAYPYLQLLALHITAVCSMLPSPSLCYCHNTLYPNKHYWRYSNQNSNEASQKTRFLIIKNFKLRLQVIDDILVFVKNRKFSYRKFSYLLITTVSLGQRNVPILVALESLIWHSLVLFQHEAQ